MTSALITETRNEADAKALLLNAGLISSETAEATATNTVTAAKLRELVQTQVLTQAEADLLATKAGIIVANEKEAVSFARLGTSVKNLGNSLLAIGKAHPVLAAITIAIGAIASIIAYAEKKNEEFIESQKELIEELDESISKYDNEISSLNSLQKSLHEAKGDKEKLASIQGELNKAIGDTSDLLNIESNAYSIANQKIDDRIKRLKELRELELEDKVNAQKEIFNNSTVDNAWGIDHKFDYFTKHRISVGRMTGYDSQPFTSYVDKDISFGATINEVFKNLKKNSYGKGKDGNEKSNAEIWKELIDSYGGAMLDVEEIQNFFDNQTEYAQKILGEYINNSESIFTKEELNKIIANLVEGGYAQDLEGIENVVTSLVENNELEDTINNYYESLYNDDVDSEALYRNIKVQFDTLINKYPELKDILENFFNNIGKDINASTNNVQVEKTLSFIDTLNSADYAEIKEELLELAKSGEITPETLSSTEEYAELLSKTETSAESATNQILDMLSAQEKLSALSQGLDKLKSAYEEFKDKDIGFVTAETLESLPDSFKNLPQFDLFSQIVGDPTSGAKAIQQAFNDIVKAYLLSQDTLQGLVGASEHDIQSYIANLKQMGITNAEEVVNLAVNALNTENELINAAQKEQEIAYQKYLKDKSFEYEKYLQSQSSQNTALVNALGETYKADYDNWCDLLSQKANAYNEFVKRIGGSYDAAYSATGNMAKNGMNMSVDNIVKANASASAYYQAQYEAERAKQQLKIDLAQISTDFGTSYSPASGSDKSSKDSSSKPSIETYDWIEVKIKRLETAIDELDQKATDTYSSLAERTKAYGDEITKVTEEIGLQSQAYNAYMAKANSYGLSADWVAKIQNGSLNIDEVTNDTLKEQISNYQTWYEKAQDCLNTVDDLQRKLKEIKIAQIQIKIDDSQATVTKLEQYADKIENRIDNEYKKTSSKDYDRLNTNIKSRISEIEKQNKLLKEQQTIAGKGTEEWDALEEQIRDNQNEIDEFNKKITENKIAKIQLKIELKGIAFDKLENLLDKLKWTTSLKNVFGFMASKENYTSQNNNIIKQIKNLNEQNKILAQQQKEVKKGSKAWNDYQSQIDDNTGSMRNLTQSMAENAVAKASLADEYAQKKIEKYNSNDELYKAKADNATWFGTKNYYTGRQMANVDNRLSAYNQATKTNLSGLNSATNTINKVKSTKTNKSLLAQVKKYTSAKKEIPASLILKASQLNDNGNLANKLYEYNAYLAAYHTSKDTADLYTEQAKQEKTELLKQQMDNIGTYYQNRADRYSQRQTEIENKIAKAEALGFTESATYYKNQANVENGKITTLKAEQVKLEQQLADGLANGKISEGSDLWYELIQQIDDCKNSIDEATNSVIEFNNKVREIEWNRFDNLQDKIALVREELSWMVDELSRDDLTSDETGSITDNGHAVAYLRAVQYETLLKQAEEYRKELSAIEKEISNNPSDINLIERKEELYEAYQDCITGAGDEKEAIIQLYTNGYEALSNKLKELVAEYEELLDAEKNAYDYQQNISDKTKEIATLRKQMLAYSGDISEETRTSVQKINVSLQEAEKSLQEAQYDKFISDSKEMLSDLQEDFDENIQTIIDNLDTNFASLMTTISESVTSSANTIATKLESLGYNPTEGVNVVINPTEDNNNGDKSVGGLAGTIIEQVKGNENDINKTADSQANKDIAPLSSNSTENTVKIEANKLKAEEEAKKQAEADKLKAETDAKKKQDELMKKIAEQTKAVSEKFKLIDELTEQSQQLQTQYNKAENDYQIARGNVIRIKENRNQYKKGSKEYDKYDKQLEVATVVRENLKVKRDEAKSKYEKVLKDLSSLETSLKQDNKVLDSLNSLKSFAKGSNNVKDEFAWTQEEGGEIIRTADGAVLTPIGNGGMVFTNEMSQKLWELAKNPAMFMNGFRSAELNLPDVQSTYQSGDVNITFGDIELPNVTDSQDFANSVESVVRNAMCKNGKTLNCVTEAVSAKQLGKGVGHARLYNT